MTICLGKSCSFGLLCVSLGNFIHLCASFSFSVLKWGVDLLVIVFLFTVLCPIGSRLSNCSSFILTIQNLSRFLSVLYPNYICST